ncbi:MAG: hypothetical protein FJX59_06015 [Alphaproteobacteria bacterium]|nr:hypothetical protein [Alphaproteobacteria bacterium]
MRFAAVMWTVLTVLAGVGIFVVKYQVQALEGELEAKQREVARDRETIRVLEAEWAYLNDPGRLRRLSEQHLGFVAPSPKTVTTIDRLPLRTEITPVADAPAAAMPEEAVTPVADMAQGKADRFSLARIKRFLEPVWDGPAFLRVSRPANEVAE